MPIVSAGSPLPSDADLGRSSVLLTAWAKDLGARVEASPLAEAAPAHAARFLHEYESLLTQTEQLVGAVRIPHFCHRSEASQRAYDAVLMEKDAVQSLTAPLPRQIGQLPAETLAAWQSAPELARWMPWVRYQREVNPTPSDSQASLSLKGKSEELKQFSSTLHFDVNGRSLDQGAINQRLASADPATRKAAGEAFTQGLKANSEAIAQRFDAIIGLSEEAARQKGFADAEAMVMKEDGVSMPAIQALLHQGEDDRKAISQEFLRWKRQALFPRSGKPLEGYDLEVTVPAGNAIPPLSPKEAHKDVIDFYTHLNPDFGWRVERMFAEGRVDDRYFPPGKEAISQNLWIPGGRPVALVQYGGSYADLSTMAHEVGHGLHYELSGSEPNVLYDKQFGMPAPLLEIFSLFAERAFHDYRQGKTDDEGEKKKITADYLDNRMFFHETSLAYHDFEQQLHALKKQGTTLDAETISDCWMKSMGTLYGDQVTQDEHLRYAWASPEISSYFTENPYYAYSYAYASRVADALYDKYKENPQAFMASYVELQKSGQRLPVDEALKTYMGLDTTQPDFWRHASDDMRGMIASLAPEKKAPETTVAPERHAMPVSWAARAVPPETEASISAVR